MGELWRALSGYGVDIVPIIIGRGPPGSPYKLSLRQIGPTTLGFCAGNFQKASLRLFQIRHFHHHKRPVFPSRLCGGPGRYAFPSILIGGDRHCLIRAKKQVNSI